MGSAIRQANLREHNLGLVLRIIMEASTPVSRADIAATTGLTRATVSTLADRLISAGLISERPPVMSLRAGRPAVPLVPAGGTLAAVGMEINVDYLGIRVVDLSGAVLAERVDSADFRGSDPAAVLRQLTSLYLEVCEPMGSEIRTAGGCLAVPGLVDERTGPLRFAPNLGWRDVDVAALFHAHPRTAGVPIQLANEATLAARAEADALRRGGRLSFLYVSGEVGIGGALVVDGAVFRGRNGWSGEIGHTVVDPAGPECRCGSFGCLEQYAGKDALMRGAGLALDLPLADLITAADADEPMALASLDSAAQALGAALANAVNLVDVADVVLGGIYGPLTPFLLSTVNEVLRTRVLSAPWSGLRVFPAEVRQFAALTGAASAVLAEVVDDPTAWLTR